MIAAILSRRNATDAALPSRPAPVGADGGSWRLTLIRNEAVFVAQEQKCRAGVATLFTRFFFGR
jgi:hypothetical protein